MLSVFRSAAILLASVVFLCAPAHAKRVALVIGNSSYVQGPLKNPVNDARAMEARLKALGFTVIKRENLRQREIGPMLREFRAAIRPGDDVLFFYAGHGLQIKGENFLPTVDAQIEGEDDVPLFSINVNTQLLTMLEETRAGVKLLFLDACRNNPYARSFRSGGGDLGRIGSAPSGTLIHYATRPGSVASDGSGANGLYTEQLLKFMGQPNVVIESMLKQVSAGVETASRGKQEPWSEGSLKGDFFFSGDAQGAAAIALARPSQTVAAPAAAQGGLPAVSVAAFEGDAAIASGVVSVLRGNFERSGRMRSVTAGEVPVGAFSAPDFAAWAGRGTGYLVGGGIEGRADGRTDVLVRVWDVAARKDLGGQRFTVDKADLRLAAQRASDFVYQKVVGEAGRFAQRQLRVAINNGRYSLLIGNADGGAMQTALTSPGLLALPTWSDDQQNLGYFSMESGKPQFYVQELKTGQRRLAGDTAALAEACRSEMTAAQSKDDAFGEDWMREDWGRRAGAGCRSALAGALR